jgi:hypothetical protein
MWIKPIRLELREDVIKRLSNLVDKELACLEEEMAGVTESLYASLKGDYDYWEKVKKELTCALGGVQ